MKYDFGRIEKAWKDRWADNPVAATKPAGSGKKYYCLDMFPYPSGSGLHVGHWRGYVLSDIYARIKWLQGYNVLHPMGWDAFGLPAENDAIKKGVHPAENTAKNIATFKKQLRDITAIYDWTKELNTTDPSYYKWTQWIFIQMFKAGLAYEAQVPINWCPSCLTGLANEEVVDNGCERCGSMVEQKNIRQWMLKITSYAEKLLSGLDKLAWPEKVKAMQRNWIGKSEGLVFSAPVEGLDLTIETFSAHFEAFAADSFVVIAPDHVLLPQLLKGVSNRCEIEEMCKKILHDRDVRKHEQLEPEGIFTGRYILDPVSGNRLPIWIANFALAHYGTGIVKCSAHDERDFAFAKKYNIALTPVLFPADDEARAKRVRDLQECYTDMHQGILEKPAIFAGKVAGSVRDEIIAYCEKQGYATPRVSYKLRDWVFSRQRYWGEPIPLIHCEQCGTIPVPEDQLPVVLPDVERYEPSGTGESPLAAMIDWVKTRCPQCDGAARRETNTMPQWAGSCWYFLRYPSPERTDGAFDTKDMDYWLPVDLYVGGVEHAILHLLYARFWVKVLHDLGYVSFDEPFTQLFNQGMILGYSEKTGHIEKMSKSKGNVVNPDDIVQQHGSDVLRVYMLFIGPPELDCEWQESGLIGVKRFLNKVWDFFTEPSHLMPQESQEPSEAMRRVQRFLRQFQERIDQFKPNTAVASFMELINDLVAMNAQLSARSMESLLISLSVMAPCMASELLQQRFGKQLPQLSWPLFDEEFSRENTETIAVQVNGKTRVTIEVESTMERALVEENARAAVDKWVEGRQIVRVIVVPGRLVNFVIS